MKVRVTFFAGGSCKHLRTRSNEAEIGAHDSTILLLNSLCVNESERWNCVTVCIIRETGRHLSSLRMHVLFTFTLTLVLLVFLSLWHRNAGQSAWDREDAPLTNAGSVQAISRTGDPTHGGDASVSPWSQIWSGFMLPVKAFLILVTRNSWGDLKPGSKTEQRSFCKILWCSRDALSWCNSCIISHSLFSHSHFKQCTTQEAIGDDEKLSLLSGKDVSDLNLFNSAPLSQSNLSADV